MATDLAPWDNDDVCPPDITLTVDEPNVLGYLLGPDGEAIATLLDRPTVPFGFQR